MATPINRHSNNESWVGAYYPGSVIDNPRSKALLCLLFDKVVCHFPVLDMALCAGHGISELFTDDPLIEAGVIELREEIVESDIEPNSNPEDYWGGNEGFNKYFPDNLPQFTVRSILTDEVDRSHYFLGH